MRRLGVRVEVKGLSDSWKSWRELDAVGWESE